MILRTYAGSLWQTQALPKASDKKHTTKGQRGRPATLITDSEALECMARYAFHGWGFSKLAKHYGVSVRYVRELCTGAARMHLIPKPSHANLEPPCPTLFPLSAASATASPPH